jgi:hypothetical protein
MRRGFGRVGLVLVGIWALAAAAVLGCGSDDDGAPPEGLPSASEDASTSPQTPPGPGEGTVTAADLVVYTRTPANLDASQSGGSAYAWAVKSAPQGSAVTTASLEGASTPKPSFSPDVSGDYVLEVKVTTATTAATKDVRVKAVAAPLFYMLSNLKEVPPYYEVRTIGMDGKGARPITCRTQPPVQDAGDGEDDSTNAFLMMSLLTAAIGLDWWEAPPGQPSRVAFQEFELKADGTGTAALAVGTNESTCQNPPRTVRVVAPDAEGGGNQPMILHPRFSPNGQRIAYTEQRPNGYYVAAVGYDGKDVRELAGFCPDPSQGDCWKEVVMPARPQWLDAQTVAWARTTAEAIAAAGDQWEIMIAKDSADPAPTRYMVCPGFVPSGFEILPDGTVVANHRAEKQGAQNLWVLRPATPGGECQVVRNLSGLTEAKSYARDFAISPDKAHVAFLRNIPEPDAQNEFGGELYFARLDGTTPPKSLSTPADFAIFGPRYVAGGAYLAYNGAVPLPEGALEDAGIDDQGKDFLKRGLPVISVAPAGGGSVEHVTQSDLQSHTFVTGGGNGGSCGRFDFNCAVSNRSSTVAGGLASGLFALAFALRRRRRR